MVWSLFLIVTVKYVIFMMRADNRGEGGIMALDGAGPPHAPAAQPQRLGADDARHVRGSAVLRRRHDHAGHLGAVGGRRPGGRNAAAAALRDPDHAGRDHRAVPVPADWAPATSARSSGRSWWCGSRSSRCSASSTSRSHPSVLAALSPHLRRAVFRGQRLDRLPGPGCGGAGGDRRRSAVCGHGPLRASARSACAWLWFVFPALRAQLFRSGRADPESARSRSSIPSSTWRRIGRSTRWSRWPHSPR